MFIILPLNGANISTLLLQKLRMPYIQGLRGRSRSKLLRALGNPPEADKLLRCGIPPEANLRPRLSRRVKKMTNLIRFLAATFGRFQKLVATISKPLMILFLTHLCHVFYATIGLPLCGNVQGIEFAIEYQNNLKIKSAHCLPKHAQVRRIKKSATL